MRSESPSGKCAKLHTVAASNSRDHMPWSLYYCLFAPHIHGCCSSRTSRSWWIAHSTQRQPRRCHNSLFSSLRCPLLDWFVRTWVSSNCMPCLALPYHELSVVSPTRFVNWNKGCRGWFQQITHWGCFASPVTSETLKLLSPVKPTRSQSSSCVSHRRSRNSEASAGNADLRIPEARNWKVDLHGGRLQWYDSGEFEQYAEELQRTR